MMDIIKDKNILKDFIFWPTIVVVFLLDQLSKNIVTNIFKDGKIWPEESPIRLAYVTNTGSAFGLFQNATLFLTIASIIGICFLFYLSLTERDIVPKMYIIIDIQYALIC